MSKEDAIAEFDETSDGTPCVTVTLRDMRGTGFWPRDYVDLDIHAARELQRELDDAIKQLEAIVPADY